MAKILGLCVNDSLHHARGLTLLLCTAPSYRLFKLPCFTRGTTIVIMLHILPPFVIIELQFPSCKTVSSGPDSVDGSDYDGTIKQHLVSEGVT